MNNYHLAMLRADLAALTRLAAVIPITDATPVRCFRCAGTGGDWDHEEGFLSCYLCGETGTLKLGEATHWRLTEVRHAVEDDEALTLQRQRYAAFKAEYPDEAAEYEAECYAERHSFLDRF